MACILDPRFKKFGLSNSAADTTEANLKLTVQQLYNLEKNKVVVDNPEPAPVINKPSYPDWMVEHVQSRINKVTKNANSSSAAIIEVDRYIKEIPLDMSNDPLIWWDENQHNFSKLSPTNNEDIVPNLPNVFGIFL